MGAERELAAARYSAMRWNAPLSEAHADRLIDDLEINGTGSVLDLGCGWAEFLIRVIESADSGCMGIGVDSDRALLDRAEASIEHRRLTERIRLEQTPAARWAEPADRVICIGASHAFGGTAAALRALTALVAPGGRLLFGDGCWEREPTQEALAIFGNDVLPLGELIDHALDAGWRLLTLSTAGQDEWDQFESSWRRGREQWALAHPEHPQARKVGEELDGRLREYVTKYRGILGFCYLTLTR